MRDEFDGLDRWLEEPYDEDETEELSEYDKADMYFDDNEEEIKNSFYRR